MTTRVTSTIRERQAALQSRFPRWVPRTLDQVLDDAAESCGDRPLVITAERTYSYREMCDWSIRLAQGLRRMGVTAGDHVGLVMANYPGFVALKYAISRVGATAVPINYFNRREELGYVLQQSDVVALVTMDRFRGLDYLEALDGLMPGWESNAGGSRFPRLKHVFVFPTSPDGGRAGAASFEQLGATAEGWKPLERRDPQAVSDIIYTSGTTGNPKGVLITHDKVLRTAYGSAYSRAFVDAHRAVFSLPLYHVYGYVEGLLACVFARGSIVLQLSFDPVATLEAIERFEANDALFVPTMTLDVLEVLKTRRFHLWFLHHLISSGGIAPPQIWGEIFERLHPTELTTGYGMTETMGTTTLTRPDDPHRRLLETNGRFRDVGVAGDPALGGRLVVYKTIDPQTGLDQCRGEVGELLARGPGVTEGYYNKPAETVEAIDAEGWLHTGDLGVIEQDDYIRLVGRVRDCYRCGGEQVIPKEIEDVLSTHPAVSQAFVVPVRDERMGEVGAAWIVGRDGARVDADELIAHCAERLARFKVPKYVFRISAADIPVTPVGRPRKFLLAEMATAAVAAQRR